jgi:hypothetical protein
MARDGTIRYRSERPAGAGEIQCRGALRETPSAGIPQMASNDQNLWMSLGEGA